MPGVIASVAVGLGYNVFVWYRRRVHGEDRHTTSSAIRQLRENPVLDLIYCKLTDEHWSCK